MIGQVILCPSCMDRVFVSGKSLAAEKVRNEGGGAANPPPPGFAADVLTGVLARMRPQNAEGANSIGIVLAVIGVVAVLVMLAVGLVILGRKSAQEDTETADAAAAAKLKPAKLEARLPTFPPPPQSPQPVAPQGAKPPPIAGAARAWSFRTSTGLVPAAFAPAGQQQEVAGLWPDVWRLPDVASAGEERMPTVGDVEAAFKVSLNAKAADFSGAGSIAVVAEVEPSTKLPAGVGEPIGSLRMEGAELLFAWADLQRDAKLASQLANCLLEISDGKKKRVVQMREPVPAEPISIDLSLDKQQIEAVIPNPPRASALQLEITELTGFSSEVKFRGGVRTTGAAIGTSAATMPGMVPGMGMPAFAGMPMVGSVTLEFPEIPGFEVHIGFRQESGKLIVSVDPTLRDEGKDGELTLRRIAQIEEDARKPLPNAQRDLDSAERSLKLWSDKLKESNSNEPPATSRRFSAWKLKHMETTRNVASFGKGVADLNARIERSKSRLDVAAKLRSFMKDSNKQATIHYVVYCECGESDLLLVDGRGR